MKPEPTFDIDGYPTEETLDTIRNWVIRGPLDARHLMDYIEEGWKYEDYFVHDGNGKYEISTGGWSGNEDMMNALHSNYIFWAFYWVESRRGGHYKFEVK